MPTKSFFLMKYFFRTMHMGSFALILGDLVFNHLWGTRIIKNVDKKSFGVFYGSICVVLLASGLINMIILIKENKFVKNLNYQIWKYSLIAKFFLTLTLTPLLEKVLPLSHHHNANPHFKIRLCVVSLLFLLSPFLRFFREYYLTKHANAKIITEEPLNVKSAAAGKLNVD